MITEAKEKFERNTPHLIAGTMGRVGYGKTTLMAALLFCVLGAAPAFAEVLPGALDEGVEEWCLVPEEGMYIVRTDGGRDMFFLRTWGADAEHNAFGANRGIFSEETINAAGHRCRLRKPPPGYYIKSEISWEAY